jgi:hypothetical protein
MQERRSMTQAQADYRRPAPGNNLRATPQR